MSPLRIETCRYTIDGTQIRVVQSARKTFPLEPREIRDLLGLSNHTIIYHIDPEHPVQRGFRDRYRVNSFERRLFDDRTILRIAAETDKLKIKRHASGLTELVGEDKKALLDIPWEEAERMAEEARKKWPEWRKSYFQNAPK